METIIILGVIIIYSGFVIYKKVKDMRNGKFCSGSCDGCSSMKNCSVESEKDNKKKK
jgi:hypothetical protein